MKFAVAALLLGTAMAQIPGLNLPADVLSYAEGLQKTNTQAFQALLGIFTAAPVQSAAAAAPHLNPAEAIQTFQAAVNQAIAAEPDSLKPIASSIVNHIAPLALTDGLLGGGGATGASSGATAGATMTGSGSASMTGSGTAMMTGSATATMSGSGSMMMTSGSMTASKASGSASGSAAGTAASSSAAAGAAPRCAVAGPAAIIAGGIMAVAAL